MRSPTRARGLLEDALRWGAVGALALTVVRLLLVAGAEPRAVHARFREAPTALARDSLAAVARAGERVTWSGEVSALAAMAEAAREPEPVLRVSIIADSFAVLADTLGTLDSLGAGGGTVTLAAGGEHDESLALSLRVAETGTIARPVAGAAAEPRRLLVLGRAGWESKFTVAALEEAGWLVDARLRLSDTMRVAQGTVTAPTLATHAAVIVLDEVPEGDAAAIARFVRSGGGLVLSGEGAASRRLAALAPARTASRLAPESRTFEGVDPLHALALLPLAPPRGDAIPLESRDDALAIAARREGAGRVVQSGFADTWRWRMEGEVGGVAAHRAWWSRLVAMAVPTVTPPTQRVSADEGAPRAALFHALGAPSEPPILAGPRRVGLPIWLGALLLAALLAEWALRRTRGVA